MLNIVESRSTFQTSTPKSSRENQNLEMEQTVESRSVEASVTKTTRSTSYNSTGPSSYQAAFGYRANRYTDQGLMRYNRGYSKEAVISPVTVSQSYAQLPGILSSRTDEKHQLSSLNDRFAIYIDKVRRLEAQNKNLTTKIIELESSRNVVSRSGDIYEDELARLRREIEKLAHDKAEIEIQLHSCVQDLNDADERVQKEINARREAEKVVKSLRKDVDDATLARMDLERKVEILHEELELLRATTNEDIETLKSHVTVRHEETFDSAPEPLSDLTDSLKDVRVAYEQLAARNTSEMERVYKKNIADLQAQVKVSQQAITASKTDAMETRRQLQSLTIEIEALRSTNSSLEAQISDLESRMEKDSIDAREKIQELEEELQKARDMLATHLADYNKLMSLKLSLDLEIATYRKLLEGEEGRISRSASNMETSIVTVEGTVTARTTSVTETSSVEHPQILVKERVRSSSSSSSSSSSDSD